MVHSVSQELFNLTRLRIVARHFTNTKAVLSVDEANAAEPIIFSLPKFSRMSIGARLNDSSTLILSNNGAVLSRDGSGAIGVHLTEQFASKNLVYVATAACLLEAGISVEELKHTTDELVTQLNDNGFILNKNQLDPLPHRIIHRS